MLIKRIDDIRLLRSSDPRVARQMLTLDPYEPVSNQPATHRDMSICVADPDMELLGDRIREVLGERGDWVENVELIQTSDYASVPEIARERLGMSPGQQNLLIRVTLRSLDGSILKDDANRVYDLVYSELHEEARVISAPRKLRSGNRRHEIRRMASRSLQPRDPERASAKGTLQRPAHLNVDVLSVAQQQRPITIVMTATAIGCRVHPRCCRLPPRRRWRATAACRRTRYPDLKHDIDV